MTKCLYCYKELDPNETRDYHSKCIKAFYGTNTYNLSHLSYHFLPNKIFKQHRESLDIDGELAKFQERVHKINLSIQEKQQKRTNVLISIFTVVTSLSSVAPILDILQGFRIS